MMRYWSTYWYNGKIYGTEIARGLDVMEILPSEYMTANEIAAATLADQGDNFNPQQQFPVTWPAEPVIARAYIDQLKRTDSLSDLQINDLNAALDRSDMRLEGGGRDRDLASTLEELASHLGSDNVDTNDRVNNLAETLKEIAKRLN